MQRKKRPGERKQGNPVLLVQRGASRAASIGALLAIAVVPALCLHLWHQYQASSANPPPGFAPAAAAAGGRAFGADLAVTPAGAAEPALFPGPLDGVQARPVSPMPVEIGVAYGTEKRNWLEWAVGEFAATEHGKRIRVNLIPMGSVEGAHAILDGDERIHVWAPASNMYLETFVRDWKAKHPGSEPIVKGEALALTPMVIVMWKNRYDAFLIKAPEVSLKMIYYAMTAPTGWGAIAGRPEWGHFKFGHTHPNQSNSGFMSLVILAHTFYDKTSALSVAEVMAPPFQEFLGRFERGVTGLSNSTGNMMSEMVYLGPASYDALLVYESVAVDYFKSAESRWGQLQVIYPRHNVWNDNPFYVLETPWTTKAHQEAADVFLQFLLSEPIQTKALDHGFRPGNPAVPVKGLQSPFVQYARFGLQIEIPSVCEPSSPEVIENLQQSWIRSAVPR